MIKQIFLYVFHFILHIFPSLLVQLSVCLHRQLFQLQCCLLSSEEEGETENMLQEFGIYSHITSLSNLILALLLAPASDRFLSVLQRNCSNCGNSFCSRCCSFKVLRSCMGATGKNDLLIWIDEIALEQHNVTSFSLFLGVVVSSSHYCFLLSSRSTERDRIRVCYL